MELGFLPTLFLCFFIIIGSWFITLFIQIYGMINGWGYWILGAIYLFPIIVAGGILLSSRKKPIPETEYVSPSSEEIQANIDYLEEARRKHRYSTL